LKSPQRKKKKNVLRQKVKQTTTIKLHKSIMGPVLKNVKQK